MGRFHAFQFQQSDLFIQAAGVAGEAAASADDAMTGHDDADGIVADGAADSLRRHA